MTHVGKFGSLCRDCDETGWPDADRCPQCGSARVVRHKALGALGLAHVDCDAFFAAIEKRDNPALADQPVIVGGGRRGVVATCCYIARAFGVRSAMPMFKALALCPDAVVVKASFDKYRDAAQLIREEMRALTPLVQPVSIDEAYLDLGGTERLHGGPPALTLSRFARTIERRVGITVSIGLGTNKLMAKIASDLDKPRGFSVIGGGTEAAAFLAPHPPTLLPGIGAAFAGRLIKDGYRTLGDLQGEEDATLIRRYGEHGLRLAARARGEDARPVSTERDTKSVSGETTFAENMSDPAALEDRLYAMAAKVSARAKEKGLAGRVVTLKLKSSGFRTVTRRTTLPHPSNLKAVLFEEGRRLLAAELARGGAAKRFRLIGIGISDLVDATLMEDGYLFGEGHRRLARREAALDRLAERFGPSAIGTVRDHKLQRQGNRQS